MIVIPRQLDQWILIGDHTYVGPTDLDTRIARLLIKGEIFGGPEDGATVDRAVDLTVGQSVSLGPNVVVTLIALVGGIARIGVQAPPHISVQTKESADIGKKKRK
jgi:sRNA-binding carbon storage regulator CsrA